LLAIRTNFYKQTCRCGIYYRKQSFISISEIILPKTTHLSKWKISKNKNTLPESPELIAITPEVTRGYINKMGCGQEGGEERITAARGHCSFSLRRTTQVSSGSCSK
jgi:hypothetical protein